ncbi:MAG: GMC family oxidoreductase [Gammaproteobacteria bacterium]|nr:GMC family oxidoreductase [Gammaproteobacteria bacterium]
MSDPDDLPAPVDVLVIGSGFGGSACALALVEAGLDVLMLERGPWRDTVPVRSMGIAARSPLPRGRRGLLRLVRTLRGRWLPGGRATLNRHGLFDIHLDRGLHVVCASGVGGGSHVYGGLNERPPDPDYWNGIAPGLGAADLEPSYQRVLARMGSRQPLADDQLPNMLGARLGANPAFVTDGVDGELTMGLAFPETPGQPRKVRTADGVERWEARPGEDGVLGSAGGGKTTLDFAFLARALQLGLKVLDLCEVSTIEHGADGTYTVHFVNHHSGRREQRTARRVVVAAGTLNTLGLLLASVAAGGLAPMAGLGERFGGNGDFFGYWKLDDVARDLSHSVPARGLLRLADEEALGPGRAWPMIAEGALPTPASLPLGRRIARLLSGGSFVAGMGADAQDGVVRWRNGRLRIDYRPDGSAIFARIRDAFRLIGERSGRRIYHFQTPITVHPTGGACIGADADHGVVDIHGQCFANPGLYVADAAAFAKPVSGPPSMSIAAWGDRVAQGIVVATG